MRLALLFLCTFSFSAYSQKYTYTFGKEGRLEDVRVTTQQKDKKVAEDSETSYPSLLSKATIEMNLEKIEVPDSRFLQQLKSFQEKLRSEQKSPFLLQMLQDNASVLIPFSAGDLSKYTFSKYKSNNVFPFDTELKKNAKKLICKKCSPPLTGTTYKLEVDGMTSKSLHYQITLDNLDNDILVKHLEKTKSLYKPINPDHLSYLRSIRKDFRREVELVNDQFQADLQRSKDFNIDLVKRMLAIRLKTKYIESAYDDALYDNKDWIAAWLWYTGGNIQLNPFEVTNDTSLVLSRIDEEIQELEDEQKLSNIMLAHDENMLDAVNARNVRISNTISDLRLRREAASRLAKKLKAWKDIVQQKNKLLYSGVWHTSSEDTIHWIHHYDAGNGFKYLTHKDSLPSMVATLDQVVTEIHNVKDGQKVNMTSSLSEFQPKSEIQTTLEEIEKLSKGANAAAGLLSKGIGTLVLDSDKVMSPDKNKVMDAGQKQEIQSSKNKAGKKFDCPAYVRAWLSILSFDDPDKVDLLGSLIDLCADQTINDHLIELVYSDRLEFVSRLHQNFDIKAITDYRKVISELGETVFKLDWLFKQTTPILQIDLKDDQTPEFRTVAEFPEKKLDITSSKTVTYKLFLDDGKEAEVTKEYPKYKQTRVLPTVGLAYVPKDRTAAIFNETTGQFESGRRFDNIEALVGVKVYVSKHKPNPVRHTPTRKIIVNHLNWRANSKRGNAFVNTLFLTGGLGLRHQFLRNYYLGTGLDLFPGVNAHIGGNFILQKRYQLVNGKILNEQEVPKTFLYFSISLDPGIVASLTNIFIK